MWRLSQGAHSGSGQEGKPHVKGDPQVSGVVTTALQERGYDVVRETADFDKIWVGTDARPATQGGSVPIQAYFIMRWLGALGAGRLRRVVRSTQNDSTHLPGAARADGAGRGARRACCSPMAFWDARAARPTSRRCAPASRVAGYRRQMRLAPGWDRAYKPANSYGPGEPNIFWVRPECWGCRCCPRNRLRGSGGVLLTHARAEGPGAQPSS